MFQKLGPSGPFLVGCCLGGALLRAGAQVRCNWPCPRPVGQTLCGKGRLWSHVGLANGAPFTWACYLVFALVFSEYFVIELVFRIGISL